jgi:hypothetical protein
MAPSAPSTAVTDLVICPSKSPDKIDTKHATASMAPAMRPASPFGRVADTERLAADHRRRCAQRRSRPQADLNVERPAATSTLQLARSVPTTGARAAISVALMPPCLCTAGTEFPGWRAMSWLSLALW